MKRERKVYSSKYYVKNRETILKRQKIKNKLQAIRNKDIKKLTVNELLQVVGYE